MMGKEKDEKPGATETGIRAGSRARNGATGDSEMLGRTRRVTARTTAEDKVSYCNNVCVVFRRSFCVCAGKAWPKKSW